MATLCESWDSNWMDGSCGFDEEGNLEDDENGTDAFEAALKPLPTWDGRPYLITNKGSIESMRNENLSATMRRRRELEWASSAPYLWPEDQGEIMNNRHADIASRGPDESKTTGNTDPSVLRASTAVCDPNVTLQQPQLQPWAIRRSTSPDPKRLGHLSEAEGALTHVIRLHRTGSVVVERKGSPSTSGDIADEVGVASLGRHSRGPSYYAEEERFWLERCPTGSAAETAVRGEHRDEAVASSRQSPSMRSGRDTQRTGTEASYDYFTAEAAYRPSTRKSSTPRFASPCSHDSDGAAGKDGRSRRRTRSTHFEEDDGLNATKEKFQQEPRPPQCRALTSDRGARTNGLETMTGAAQRRRSRSLRDAENVLHGVLESMAEAAPTNDAFASEDEDVDMRELAESSSPTRSTPRERRASVLRQRVEDLLRGEAESPTRAGTTHRHYDEVDRTKPSQGMRGRRYPHDGDDDSDHYDRDTCKPNDQHGQSPRWERTSPLERSTKEMNRRGFGVRGVARGADSQTRRECDAADESAGRVAELGRRIAVRCLHMEQECLRRERAQTRLFQEQLRGARQAAQEAARQIIRDERSRSNQVLTEVKKRFEVKEKELKGRVEQAEESWKTERETLGATATAAKSEVDRIRRQAREAAEAGRKDTEKAIAKQRLDLQRGWAEEKGGIRRSAEDALRRAVEGHARAEERAALEAQTVQESLSAQVRSWKAKAESAERRALEERDKRRELEAGAKGALAQEMDKAREEQEHVLRDLRTKAEGDRVAHANEIERLEGIHRSNLLRVHEEKKKLSDTARRRWQQDMQELRVEAAAKAADAATRAAAERAEALRSLRMAHDAEMRKAGRDILRLERELRRCEQDEPKPVLTLLKSNAPLSPLPLGSYSPKPLRSEDQVGLQSTPSLVPGSLDTAANPSEHSAKHTEVVVSTTSV